MTTIHVRSTNASIYWHWTAGTSHRIFYIPFNSISNISWSVCANVPIAHIRNIYVRVDIFSYDTFLSCKVCAHILHSYSAQEMHTSFLRIDHTTYNAFYLQVICIECTFYTVHTNPHDADWLKMRVVCVVESLAKTIHSTIMSNPFVVFC